MNKILRRTFTSAIWYQRQYLKISIVFIFSNVICAKLAYGSVLLPALSQGSFYIFIMSIIRQDTVNILFFFVKSVFEKEQKPDIYLLIWILFICV